MSPDRQGLNDVLALLRVAGELAGRAFRLSPGSSWRPPAARSSHQVAEVLVSAPALSAGW